MRAVLILAIALLAGCASTGNNFNAGNLARLEPGITTVAQASELLGARSKMRCPRCATANKSVFCSCQRSTIRTATCANLAAKRLRTTWRRRCHSLNIGFVN